VRAFLLLCLVCIPAAPLLAGLVVGFRRSARGAGLVATAAAGLSLLSAVLAVVLLAVNGSTTLRWAPWGGGDAFALALRLDLVSVVMAVLVALVGGVVVRFSRAYLAGDLGERRFFAGISLTLSAVLLLVISGNLLLLLAAWILTSMGLHRLLLHDPSRPGARFAARLKFVFSRLADLSLALALVILYRHQGTLDLEALLQAAEVGRADGMAAAGWWLAAGAALKSAQFPFHTWLPETMETPTPVSALMHAGIINAGGFLLVRLAPLMAQAPGALAALAVVGAVTAGFGSVVMLTQPTVKRALAFSTIAQMGFMILQCGLGAFGLALVHLVAHSIYKAHAFLTAGSSVGAVARAAIPLRTSALVWGVIWGGGLAAAGAALLSVVLPRVSPYLGILSFILALALAYGLARGWSASHGLMERGRVLGSALGIVLAAFTLHAWAGGVFVLTVVPPPTAVVVVVAVIFACLFIFQALLWRAGRTAAGRWLYVHAASGFYVGTWVQRALGWLWPHHPVVQA
jgi:NAD(P)H-quinone oxidoreductase subunit 5